MNNQKRTMGRAAVFAVIIMAVSNLLSRLLGFVRMMVLANAAGMSAHVDAYSYSFVLPDIINHILAGSALSITFIPVFQDIFTHKGEKEAWRFFSNIFTVGTILFAIVIVFALGYTEQLLAFAGKNIKNPDHPEQYALTVSLTRIIIPAQLFFFWGALLNGVQYANKRFVLPALTPLLYNVGIIIGGTLLFPYLKIAGFSWGVLGGAFLGNVVVQIPGALRVGMKYRPYINLRDHDLRRWFVITIPLVLGLGMTFSNEVLFRAFGSGTADGSGAIAALDYSYKAMMFLVGIFGQSFAAGIYPFLSQFAVEKRFTEMNRFITDVLTKVAALAIPVSMLFFLCSEQVIGLLYQRGRFDSSATLRTAQVFACYLPGTFFMSAGLVVMRVFYAMKNTVLPLIISTASVVVSLPLYYLFERLWGARGIAASASITVTITFLFLMLFWRVTYKNEFVLSFLKTLALVFLYTCVGFGVGYGMKSLSGSFTSGIQTTFLKNGIILLATCIPSLACVGFLLDVTGVVSTRDMAREAYGKLSRKVSFRRQG